MTEYEVRAFIDRFEEEFAVLLLGDEGEQVLWPARFLPEDAAAGSVVVITIAPDAAATRGTRNVINSLIDHLEHGK